MYYKYMYYIVHCNLESVTIMYEKHGQNEAVTFGSPTIWDPHKIYHKIIMLVLMYWTSYFM